MVRKLTYEKVNNNIIRLSIIFLLILQIEMKQNYKKVLILAVFLYLITIAIY